MLYLILFGLLVGLSSLIAVYCRNKLGDGVTFFLGGVLSGGAVVLFFLNKSDSVADSFLEKLADMSPPLITGSIVIGWWIGYTASCAISKFWTGQS